MERDLNSVIMRDHETASAKAGAKEAWMFKFFFSILFLAMTTNVSAHECRSIQNASDRLECYDAREQARVVRGSSPTPCFNNTKELEDAIGYRLRHVIGCEEGAWAGGCAYCGKPRHAPSRGQHRRRPERGDRVVVDRYRQQHRRRNDHWNAADVQHQSY